MLKTKADPEALSRLRHSAAHVLAQAVLDLFPETKLAIGPAIKDGFYYDFERDEPFTEDDLKRLEAKMQKIVDEAQALQQRPVTNKEAHEFFDSRKQPYKLEILDRL